MPMMCDGDYYGRGGDRRKPWRYPGVPIPFRLQYRYKIQQPEPKRRRR